MLIKPTKKQLKTLKSLVENTRIPYNIRVVLYKWFYNKRKRFNTKTMKDLRDLGYIELTKEQEDKILLDEHIKRIMG